jgi:threonine 3-dehydrogenase
MLTLKGIYGREMYESWYQMSVLVQAGLDITPVITHQFSYADFEEAFAIAASGDAGKVLLDWTTI